MNSVPSIYLGVVDGALDWMVSQDDFRDSLIVSALFRGNIRIPDVFFFIDGPLRRAVTRDQYLVGELLRSGIIKPMFRDQAAKSFREALESLKGIQGKVGSIKAWAARLDGLTQGPETRFSPGYWNAQLGAQYKDHVRRVLQPESGVLPKYLCADRGLEALWNHTEHWRNICIADAIEAAPTQKDGLRHADIVNAVAWSIGVPRSRKLHRASQVLAFAAKNRRPPAERRALRHFFQWIREIYHYTQSDDFKAKLVFGNVSLDAPLVQLTVRGESLRRDVYEPLDLVRATATSLRRQWARERRENRCTFSIPHPRVLWGLSPSELIGARRGEGEEYFRVLGEFESGRCEWNDLRDSVKAYARVLSRKVEGQKSTFDIFRESGGEPLVLGTLAYLCGSNSMFAAQVSLLDGVWLVSRWLRSRKWVELRANVEVGPQDTTRRTRR